MHKKITPAFLGNGNAIGYHLMSGHFLEVRSILSIHTCMHLVLMAC